MEKKEFDLWLDQLFSYEFLTECIPDQEMHQFLLDNIDSYSDEVILNILRCLLHSYWRPMDRNMAEQYKNPEVTKWFAEQEIPYNKSEYYHRIINDYEAWEGLTWIVQLVRNSPMDAIKALSLYLTSECGTMSDFRLIGIGQCIDIIEEKFIKNFTNKEMALLNLHPRKFEILIYELYCAMGYNSELTPATRDGGKDVIANRDSGHGIETLYIECKRYKTTALNPEIVNALFGVIMRNQEVSRGVIFTTVKVFSQLKDLIPRITVLEINEVILLLNSYLGYNWDERIDLLTN
ncbi:restriction endonuclease [Anaeromicropila herbilytica]|uniref:Restriction endonuclease type IV Mrr domain-containing protein n=1 Tax=Anaeromicropila herbilytica TaxID=2785025 RepID=A0A7R7IAX6_9FIRM|nr:restriction endonuclease [Anaeromicropila herbilytica]BCN28938.1 hypothetical protein bsdtb5_02330 [Anaeromicropila herbilytica]